MSAVVNLQDPDPVTDFLRDLHELGPVAWAAVAMSSRERDGRLWEWDEAYQAALESGGGWAASAAAAAAEEAGTGSRAAAMAAGAAAALAAQHGLDESAFELLYRPVAEIVGRAGRRPAVYTTRMPNWSRPLPA